MRSYKQKINELALSLGHEVKYIKKALPILVTTSLKELLCSNNKLTVVDDIAIAAPRHTPRDMGD